MLWLRASDHLQVRLGLELQVEVQPVVVLVALLVVLLLVILVVRVVRLGLVDDDASIVVAASAVVVVIVVVIILVVDLIVVVVVDVVCFADGVVVWCHCSFLCTKQQQLQQQLRQIKDNVTGDLAAEGRPRRGRPSAQGSRLVKLMAKSTATQQQSSNARRNYAGEQQQ